MEDNLTELETRINQLLELCTQLKTENSQLRIERDTARQAQSKLYKKNREAVKQVKVIISNLDMLTR